MNSKGKIVVKVHHKIGAKSMMLALFMKIFFFSFLPKSGPDKWCRVRKDRGHYGHFYWALVLGTYLGFGPHILV